MVMDIKVKKILLTGGSGMLGTNILEHVAAKNYNFVAPRRSELNLQDYQATAAYIAKLQPDLIIHAAGKVGGIQANIANPVDFLISNIDMGRNLVMAAHACGVKRVLNIASSCMYPREAISPLEENLILTGELEPTNEGYALAKIVITRLCQYINKENIDCRYKTIIPCNLYGRHDKFSPEHSHLVPAIIHKVHCAKTQNQNCVEIWGDGTARREFMYAGDAADAILHAVNDFDALPDIMNIGLGYDYTINEFYEVAANVMGWQGEFIHDVTKPVGMKQKLVCVKKQQAIGWAPKTTLQEGIAKTYAYYLENVNHEHH
jgi:GDP-L-fucose synthase